MFTFQLHLCRLLLAIIIIILIAVITPEKWEKMMKDNNWNNVELRDNRYNQIIHMVSAANGAEDYYSTEVNIKPYNF